MYILSHGAAGELQLGNGMLDQRTLDEQADRIAAWGRASAPTPTSCCTAAMSPAAPARLSSRTWRRSPAPTSRPAPISAPPRSAATGRSKFRQAASRQAWRRARHCNRNGPGYSRFTTPNASAADGAVNSLRWAITQANGNAGVDTINLAAGTYTLTLAGNNDNDNLSGDLDILEGVQIVGASAKTTFVDGSELDRIFDVRSGATTLSGVTLREAATPRTVTVAPSTCSPALP